MARCTFLLLSLLVATGCGRPVTDSSRPEKTPPRPSEGDVETTATVSPTFSPVEVFINNGKSGDSNGCTTTFTPQPKSFHTEMRHSLTCGHPGAVSKLEWEYVRTDDEGDRYHFERVFPYQEPGQETTSKEILYTGQELLLFEDESQRIVIRPPSDESESHRREPQ